jgi:membrane associated rhomboid family serine protease
LFLVKTIEILFDLNFTKFGIYPLHPEGIPGILFAPLVHGSWGHLLNNSIPLLVLTTTLFYFYREVSYKVFFLIYFIHGFWLWFFARDSYHIGSSGIIYGLGAFLFVSGIIRKNSHLLAISLLIVFLYGSMIWGIFPRIESISWEAHLTGMVSGIILAYYYKQYGPAPNIGRWKQEEIEDELAEQTDEEYWKKIDEQTEKERTSDNDF